ncbi:MAG: dihydropteroate synthase [Xanthobacteraceae bacterium]|jgi:dihydropteroate synthase
MRAAQRAKRDAFLDKIGIRPVVMGILNVTPDSFSDGRRFIAADAALSHATQMWEEGADIVDIGGESTRPGALPVTEAEEFARIQFILAELGSREIPISIDTYKANIAVRALDLGAVVVNDVWGLQKDPAMADAVAAAGAAVVIMHNRAEKDSTIDIIADIRRFFTHSLTLADKAGIPRTRIVLDPGIAFGKTARQNVEVIVRLRELMDFDCPILIGVSRKAFLGSLIEGAIESTPFGTIAASLAACAAGASLFRVHDVAEHVAALKVFHAVWGARGNLRR